MLMVFYQKEIVAVFYLMLWLILMIWRLRNPIFHRTRSLRWQLTRAVLVCVVGWNKKALVNLINTPLRFRLKITSIVSLVILKNFMLNRLSIFLLLTNLKKVTGRHSPRKLVKTRAGNVIGVNLLLVCSFRLWLTPVLLLRRLLWLAMIRQEGMLLSLLVVSIFGLIFSFPSLLSAAVLETCFC